jgi:1,4-dihydroxy-6-naphthoate synthase
MKIAYSPCPNDTFIFHAWAHGLLPEAPELEVVHADIDRTNSWARNGKGDFDILKISYAALPHVLDKYALLPCGGALGAGCGPLLLLPEQPLEKIKKIAVPSDSSTAYLLLRLWWAEQTGMLGAFPQIVVIPYDRIMPALVRGEYDAGLVIHEARFTYQQYGLRLSVDLGEWWESSTGMLIPLGAIVARRGLDHEVIAARIRDSLQYARRNPGASEMYIRQHAQEWERSVVEAHINLYVNEYSLDIGRLGRASIEHLFERALAAGLYPPFELQI